MRLRRFAAMSAAALAFAGAGSVSSVAPVAVAKPCSASFTHAVIRGAHKCLRQGQFCIVGYSGYARYGFYCPSSGHLRRR
jgi:hypothetical protein